MRGYRSRILVLALFVCAAQSLVGCRTPAATVSPPLSVPETFSVSGADEVPERWWAVFDDEQLNAVVDTALASNFDLMTAWERLIAAQAIVDREASALLPDLQGSALGEISRTEGQTTGTIELGLSSVYEADLWGRIRSSVDAERFRAEATRADYQAAALSLAAEIVSTWYQLAEASSEVDLIDEQIATNLNVLELLENRFAAGQIRVVDILRQSQLVEATREQRTYAASRMEVLEHRLSVLIGRAPQYEMPLQPDVLPDLPPLPETGLPIELVRRRPDVRSAFYLLRAADRDLAAAISSRFPRLTLSAAASSSADNPQNLFRDWLATLAGNLVAPIFYGGELSAEVDRVEAVRAQRLYEYGQTALVAFQEVEDALALELSQLQSIQHLEDQVDLAEQAYDQLQVEYLNGTSNYIDVLTALDELQELRRDLLAAELALVEYRIALYRALAGSFENGRQLED